jgi:hypothetical protein
LSMILGGGCAALVGLPYSRLGMGYLPSDS